MKSKRDSRLAARPLHNARKLEAIELLNQALAAHQSGRLAEAERVYRTVLARDGSMADAHHLLGLALHQQGRSAEGAVAIEQALRRMPHSSNFQVSYGATLAAVGRLGPATTAFRRALGGRPADALALRNLATAELGLDRADAAMAAASRACVLDRGDKTAWIARAHAARRKGLREVAADACRRALAIDGTHDEARFLLESLEGAPARPPPGYVRDVFDKYAGHFDRDLVDGLGYRTPTTLAELAARHLHFKSKSLSVLDLGCGTGLAAVALQPFARRIVGLDLSPAMLAAARKRDLYAQLVEGDIETMSFDEHFDLVVAADVLNYLGDLGPAFDAIDRALPPAGAALFSVEALTEGGAFRLTEDLRYAHDGDHVRRLAAARGWTEVAAERAELRRQAGRPVDGLLFLFRKAG